MLSKVIRSNLCKEMAFRLTSPRFQPSHSSNFCSLVPLAPPILKGKGEGKNCLEQGEGEIPSRTRPQPGNASRSTCSNENDKVQL
jgi:hypothetical protein